MQGSIEPENTSWNLGGLDTMQQLHRSNSQLGQGSRPVKGGNRRASPAANQQGYASASPGELMPAGSCLKVAGLCCTLGQLCNHSRTP